MRSGRSVRSLALGMALCGIGSCFGGHAHAKPHIEPCKPRVEKAMIAPLPAGVWGGLMGVAGCGLIVAGWRRRTGVA